MKENLPDDAPILYIVHTLGGGSRESCTNFMAMLFMKNSYRVVICSFVDAMVLKSQVGDFLTDIKPMI